MAENGYQHLRRDDRSVAGGILDAPGLDAWHLGKNPPYRRENSQRDGAEQQG
jgi:hypothetical protein